MDWHVILTVVFSVFAASAAALPITIWLLHRLSAAWIDEAIRHSFEKKLEDVKHANTLSLAPVVAEVATNLEATRFEIRQREQAAMVARLLAEWSAPGASDTKLLNELAWTASLWLPAEAARKLTSLLSYDKENPTTSKDVLIAVRKVLKGDNDPLTAAEIVHFPDPTTQK